MELLRAEGEPGNEAIYVLLYTDDIHVPTEPYKDNTQETTPIMSNKQYIHVLATLIAKITKAKLPVH